jgi:predicted small integral membrane protein
MDLSGGRRWVEAPRVATLIVLIPRVDPSWVSSLSEAFQALAWHRLVGHPALQRMATKW